MRRLLEPLGIELLSLADYPHLVETPETGATFEENAALKATAAAAATGLVALADDSGLEVAALGGRPGILSQRYGATDQDRIARLLAELAGVRRRAARFVAAVAIAWPDGRVETVRGTVEGEITREPRGSGGFGFDPVFQPTGESRTMAEMTAEEKNAISHRGKAFGAAVEVLRRSLPEI